MSKYYSNISKELKDYFAILELNFSEWLMNILIQNNCYRNNN